LQLFYLINGWAGRNDFADAALRLFYVGAVPLLATALAAILILAPRREKAPSRWQVALAAVLAIGLCALTRIAIEAFTCQFLNTEILSPRPFVTHYTTLLLIEPNDNSFPCPEVMIAATLAVLIWAALPTAGIVVAPAVLLFCFTRLFCGSNYVADVAVGAGLGACWAALSLAFCRISIQVPLRDGRSLVWRVRPQAFLSGGAALLITAGAFFSFASTPRYGPILRDLWRGSTATAAPAGSTAKRAAPLETALMMGASLPRTAEHEGGERDGRDGQDATTLSPIAAALRSRTAGLDGHLPRAEELLSKALGELNLSHRILGVEVAQVRAGHSPYRCAAVYFEVRRSGVAERRRVAATTAAIVKRAFHIDAQLQNIDVVGAILNDGSPRNASPYVFTVGEVPVFTASVQRGNLRIINGPQWVNLPNVDPGLWLRARSRLYINARVLPASLPPAPTPLPTPTAQPTATPSPTATPLPTATPPPTPRPTAVPQPTATSRPVPTVRPTTTPNPLTQPTTRPKPRPTNKPLTRGVAPIPKPAIKPPLKPPVKRVAPRRPVKRQYARPQRRATPRRVYRRSIKRRARGYWSTYYDRYGRRHRVFRRR